MQKILISIIIFAARTKLVSVLCLIAHLHILCSSPDILIITFSDFTQLLRATEDII